MRQRWPRWRLASAGAIMLIVAGSITGVSPPGASASTCQSLVAGQPPSPGSSVNHLNAVTVISPCNAWAVGAYASGGQEQNLVEHWNGASWKVVASPHPGTGSFLDGVRAVSPSNIWAVGASLNGTFDVDLIMHWNGRAWTQVASPSPGRDSRLTAVRAVSAKDVWAAGIEANKVGVLTIMLHWNGHVWAQVPSPDPGGANDLYGLAATSASDVWAVGISSANGRTRTLILHWNGRRWAQVPSPNPSTMGEFLESVSATSASNAWAVGNFANGSGQERTLILHWNGRTWARVPSPNPGDAMSGDVLSAVVSTAKGNAWAVGGYVNASNTIQNVVILHWNGRKWLAQAGPTPGMRNQLFAVAANSSSDIWAVGDFSIGGAEQNFALHCC